MRLLAGYATDVGHVREGNEDSFLVDRALALFAVADGMGGHLGGEVASRTAVETLRAAVASGTPIEDAVRRANAAVFERAGTDESLYGMGTTLTALITTNASELLIGHVGDSRAYLLRAGELRRLTEDHSLVEELVREGRITEEQAAVHPQRSIITRALGVEPDVDVDLYTLEVAVADRVLICSDGLTTMVDDREIERLLRDVAEPQAAAEQLVDAALAAGGTDNVTAVVIDVRELGATNDVEAPVDASGDASADGAPVPDATSVLPVAGPSAIEEHGSAPATASTVGDSHDVAVRPRRSRRVLRAAFWTAVTIAPIAAVGTVGYVVYRNDHSTTTTVPGGGVTSTTTVLVTTTTVPARGPTTTVKGP